MKELSESEVKSLNFTKMTPLDFAEIYDKLPNCFVCVNKASGTNYLGDMWTCGVHWNMTLDDAIKAKYPDTQEQAHE